MARYCSGEMAKLCQRESTEGWLTHCWNVGDGLPTIWSSSLKGRCCSYISRNFSIQNVDSPNRFSFPVTPLVKVNHCMSYEPKMFLNMGKSSPAWAEATGTMVARYSGASRKVIH